jgi:hypothetical protein
VPKECHASTKLKKNILCPSDIRNIQVGINEVNTRTYLKFQSISFEVCIQESILFNSQANPVLLVLYLPLLIFYGLPAVAGTL